MTTNKNFSRTSPDKANELFAKLLETSDTAVKTRERLFADLRAELELLASLQEQYLFPVLRDHKETQDLVSGAMQDIQETGALLADLDQTPRNDPEFIKKVANLRKVFQRHIRDDKNELLPAVLKVLGDDEAKAIAEQVQSEMDGVEEAKRAEVEQRRVEVRREREQTDNVRAIAEDVVSTVQTGFERSRQIAQTMQDAIDSGLSRTSELASFTSDRATRFDGLPLWGDWDPTKQATQNLQTLAASGTALARRVQDVSEECMALAQKRLQRNLDGLNALAQCRSVQDLFALQQALIRANLEQTIESGQRLVELSARIADETARTVNAQAKRVGRAA